MKIKIKVDQRGENDRLLLFILFETHMTLLFDFAKLAIETKTTTE